MEQGSTKLNGASRLAAVAIVAFGLEAPHAVAPALVFHPHDSLLITHIDNRTGDDIFDDTIELALRHELLWSPRGTLETPFLVVRGHEMFGPVTAS